MKIIFLCSGLEPGRDGVGDYTRRLAAEFVRKGHLVAIISLNDKHVTEKFSGVSNSEGIDLSILRLPTILRQKKRFEEAKKYIDEFNPEWLSFQFVIFGYQPKGLPRGLGKQLHGIGKGRKWHMMFHELWLGIEYNATKKHIIWGWVQKQIVKQLLAYLKPAIVNTQTNLYKRELTKLGLAPQILPLFSNIPLVSKDFALRNLDSNMHDGTTIDIVLFGHIHPLAPIHDFAIEVATWSSKNKVSINLKFVGRCGAQQENWVAECTAVGLNVSVFGELPFNEVSRLLSSSSFGISSTPFAVIEKSGSAAAMLEHGLPVICVAHEWVIPLFDYTSLLDTFFLYKKGNFDMFMKAIKNRPSSNSVSTVARQLINVFLNHA